MTIATNVSMSILNVKVKKDKWYPVELLEGCSLENPEDQWNIGEKEPHSLLTRRFGL